MQYQIKYKSALHIINHEDVSDITIANHFAENGYDYLYVCQNDRLKSIVTFEDFTAQKLVCGLNRDFVIEKQKLKNNSDIHAFYQKHPDVDKIVVVENGDVVYQIDPLIELSLQNGTAKNLMALRYAAYFQEELNLFFGSFSGILLIAEEDIRQFLVSMFPDTEFEAVEDISLVKEKNIGKYDLILDFKYGKRIRKIAAPELRAIDFCQIVTNFAFQKLLSYSAENNIIVKFYKLPVYSQLTCLHPEEYRNYKNRTTAAKLIMNDAYLKKYAADEEEYTFLKSHSNYASLRLDNGYCFVHDESNHPDMHVHNGIRHSVPENKTSAVCWHFYGPCTTYGLFVPDNMTVPSLVKQYAAEQQVHVNVSNKAGIHGNNGLNSIMYALNTPVRAGDAFIFLDVLNDFPEEAYPEIQLVSEWFNQEKSREEIQFLDFPGHCNSAANRIMAAHIFEDMKKTTASFDSSLGKYHTFIKDYAPLPLAGMTNASCRKFLKNSRERIFSKKTFRNIGSLLLSDTLTCEQCMTYIRKTALECDALYVFKCNDVADAVNDVSTLYQQPEFMTEGIPVRVFHLEHFFNAERYFNSSLCWHDCRQNAMLTESMFFSVVLVPFDVMTLFHIENTEVSIKLGKIAKELCLSNHISFRRIE